MVSQLRKLNDEERTKRLTQWADRITGIAIGMCIHAKSGDKDGRGNTAFPCPECIRVVEFVTKKWAGVMAEEYTKAVKVESPIVMRWHTAYRTAGAVLEPDWAIAVDPIGPL